MRTTIASRVCYLLMNDSAYCHTSPKIAITFYIEYSVKSLLRVLYIWQLRCSSLPSANGSTNEKRQHKNFTLLISPAFALCSIHKPELHAGRISLRCYFMICQTASLRGVTLRISKPKRGAWLPLLFFYACYWSRH